MHKYYEWKNECCEWINEYYEYCKWSSKYYKLQDRFCDNNYPELMLFLIQEFKIAAFLLKVSFRKPL